MTYIIIFQIREIAFQFNVINCANSHFFYTNEGKKWKTMGRNKNKKIFSKSVKQVFNKF